MWRYFQPNPSKKSVGDCAVRAITKALGTTWNRAFDILTEQARSVYDLPSSDAVWSAVLKHNGFSKAVIPNSCPDCMTAEQFLENHPYGIYVLAFGGHVATAIDGVLYDSWDSSQEVPVYYFYRR